MVIRKVRKSYTKYLIGDILKVSLFKCLGTNKIKDGVSK
jgi:hypothetical protein